MQVWRCVDRGSQVQTSGRYRLVVSALLPAPFVSPTRRIPLCHPLSAPLLTSSPQNSHIRFTERGIHWEKRRGSQRPRAFKARRLAVIAPGLPPPSSWDEGSRAFALSKPERCIFSSCPSLGQRGNWTVLPSKEKGSAGLRFYGPCLKNLDRMLNRVYISHGALCAQCARVRTMCVCAYSHTHTLTRTHTDTHAHSQI